jgi:NADPH:quinone reductase-like Zn-dependent oxidoreductase
MLVRVKAVGVNPVEPLIRSGQFPLIGQPPFILGWDISGVIEHLEGVTRFDIGDEVHGMPFFLRAASAYAQYVTAPSRLSVEPDYPGLEAPAGLVDSGELRVHLQTTLPLAEAAKAHQLLESGRTTGKIALTI